jgi:hypothetical protein
MSAPSAPPKLRILAYGVETKGLQAPAAPIPSSRYSVEFAPHNHAARFQEFDGVIVFQGTFESFERVPWRYNSSRLKHHCQRDELDKRTKEAMALFERGGFICVLLTDPFIDSDEGRDLRETDLSKRLLISAHRNPFSTRMAIIRSKVDELGKFFKLFGAAWSSLYAKDGDEQAIKTLAAAGNRSVSVVIDGRMFAVPTLIPRETEVEEYFTLLADGVVSLWERLRNELPEWAGEYRFPEETGILAKRQQLTDELCGVDEQLDGLSRLKRVLATQSDVLVDAVMEVFDKGLSLKSKREESFREDLVLLDAPGDTIALAEVKGVSRGVTREHVNQADSHRERNGLPPTFPSLLIVNTNMRNSTCVADKDQNVAAEQIEHAARNNVLILRTLDLLNLASLHLSGELKAEDVVRLLTTTSGWLRVGDTADILTS